jgi:hypothetical protein
MNDFLVMVRTLSLLVVPLLALYWLAGVLRARGYGERLDALAAAIERSRDLTLRAVILLMRRAGYFRHLPPPPPLDDREEGTKKG